jgi:DNA mismatch endonuclease (patch repair protein)
MHKTKEQISYNMQQVKSKDTKIEVMLRKELWSRGLRYQKNSKKVFGKPDIVFIGKKVAVFCDSEFWHGYVGIIRKRNSNHIKSFGFLKLKKTLLEIIW